MARKITQIAVCGVERTQFTQCSIVTVALCDDGTVWHLYNEHEGWYRQPNVPQEDEEEKILQSASPHNSKSMQGCPQCKTDYDVGVFQVCENCGHRWA